MEDTKPNLNYGKIARDTTMGIFAYEVITGIIIFGACYKYKPTQTFLNSKYGNDLMNYLKNKFPNQHTKLNNLHDSILLSMSKNNYLKNITKSIGLKTKQSIKAFAEGFILGKIFIPINMVAYGLIGKLIYNHHNTKYDSSKQTYSNNLLYPLPKI